MAEELVLNAPVTVPAEVTTRYKVISLLLDLNHISKTQAQPGLVVIYLEDNLKKIFVYKYEGQVATDYIKFLNTANLTIKSMHKRILEKLSNDGILPGTVVGQPDPVVGE